MICAHICCDVDAGGIRAELGAWFECILGCSASRRVDSVLPEFIGPEVTDVDASTL
jgi:hypothetical protein